MAADNSHGRCSSPDQYYSTISYDPRLFNPKSAHLVHGYVPPPQIEIDAPPCPFDSWADSLAEGVNLQASILEKDGYGCLYRPEYQLPPNGFTASVLHSSQEATASPPNTSSPLYFDSPPSSSSQDGSVTSPGAHPPYRSSKTVSTKKFKCQLVNCPYSSSRQDHVRDHFKAHHEGNRYVCGLCNRKLVYKGDFASHSCNAPEKELNTTCTLCDSTINKKGLKRHQETIKCKNNQIAR